MRRRIRATRTATVIAILTAAAIAAAGCSRAGSSGTGSAGPAQPAAAAGNFGSLTNVCHPGSAAGATDQGVTSAQIQVGVLTDVGFTKDPQLVNAAHVFTSWCDAAGGIDGRKLVADIHDTQLMAIVPAMASACAKDFALVGGSAALDGLAVDTRLRCLLPDYDAQTVMPQNRGSSLQVYPISWAHSYSPYAGYFQWLLKQAYPGSGQAVAIVAGQSGITAPDVDVEQQTLKAEGAATVDQVYFPVTGVTSWTPYAEAIKAKGIKGMTFLGTPQQLAALELALTTIGYQLDWIDANSDSYGAGFVQVAGKALSFQHNYAMLSGVYPAEKASSNPATAQVVSLYAKYAPGQPVTLQALQAFSAWLIFAVSANTCGSGLTRTCAYAAALNQAAWDGGGLTAPVNVSQQDSPQNCFDVEQATPAGWQPAPFGPNDGAYRCGAPVYKIQGPYPPAITLADVGKSLSDLR
jgi:hypothetical protein